MSGGRSRESLDHRDVAVEFAKIPFAITRADRENMALRDFGEVGSGLCEACKRPCGHGKITFKSPAHESEYAQVKDGLGALIQLRAAYFLMVAAITQKANSAGRGKPDGSAVLDREDSSRYAMWQTALIDEMPSAQFTWRTVKWAMNLLDEAGLPPNLSQWREAMVAYLEELKPRDEE